MTTLALEGAAFAHEDRMVFANLSVGVRPGDRIALLGANGSGKSTLFRLLAASWRPTAGRLLLDGERVRYSSAGRNRVRKAVQLVLQEPDEMLFAMTVRADVSYGPQNLGLEPEEVARRAERAMAATEVRDLADRVPHQLSYGQRKRVALAGALAMEPDVLLLDEPTAGLDPAGTEQLIGTLAATRAAVVLATHDVNLAYRVADTAWVFAGGELHTGKANELLADQELLREARLELPWAPVVSQALGRSVRTAWEV